MVDWERVERLRSKGVDWDTIAEDQKVKFTPPEGVSDTGRALKTMYYTRKSNRSHSGGKKKSSDEAEKGLDYKGFLMPGGVAIAVLGAIWFPFAYETSLVGFLVPAIPYVLLVIIAGVILLAVSFVLNTGHLSEIWKKPVAIGLVFGLMIPGALALADSGLGVPNLSGNTFGEPGGWESESPQNHVWTGSNGLPVFFFYGSIACPYCSASSWAMYQALSSTGTMTPVVYGTSNPNDVYPNTPEVRFDGVSYSSNYVSLDAQEGTDDYSTAALPPLNYVEQAYVNMYDNGGIPFVVVGGIFVHVGTLVNPSLLNGMQPSEVVSIIQQGSSNTGQNLVVYNAIHQAQLYLEAYFVKSCQIAGVTPPTFGGDETTVKDIVAAIH